MSQFTGPNDPARHICLDCAIDTRKTNEYYMVHDSIWALTGLDKNDGQLCITCLEERINRKLTPADFTGAPINSLFWWRFYSE